VGDDNGVRSVVDNGDGTATLNTGIGFAPVAPSSRNGNLQIAQFNYGAVQPSQLAADVAGALLYGTAHNNGFPVSAPDLLQTGNLDWDGVGAVANGTGVATDQTGSGTAYEYRWPGAPGDLF